MGTANQQARAEVSVHGSGLIPVFSTDAGCPPSVKTGLRKQEKTEKESQMAETTEQHDTAAEHLEDALDDLNSARQSAQDELRSSIDSAISRAREALDDLRSDTEERAENLRTRAKNQAADWQRALEDATEDARRELGVRAVHAQRSQDALDAMSEEIKRHMKEIAA
jgi:uncharacterized FlaG/YvyC family protein